jgi:hypothetical protein
MSYVLQRNDEEYERLRRLWDRIPPEGHLVIQEHDMVGPGAVPPLERIRADAEMYAFERTAS